MWSGLTQYEMQCRLASQQWSYLSLVNKGIFCLFSQPTEQRQHNSRMTKTEQNWTEENTMQQHWEEMQRDRNEVGYLKTKTEQQQEDIYRLTAEKHEQDLLIKRLSSQVENVIKKLEEKKNEATQEKMQLMTMWAEIYQEREILDRRYNEIINERHKLKLIESVNAKVQMENMKSDSQKPQQDTDVSVKATQWETEMADIQKQKQDLENRLAQVQSEREEIERIKTKTQTEQENIETARQAAKAEMDAMKSMKESNERQKEELDNVLQMTKKEMRELEVMNTEMEIKKKHLVKIMRMSRRNEEKFSKMKNETECAKQDMEGRSEHKLEVEMKDRANEQRVRLQQEQNNTEMKRMILKVEEIREMLRMVREETEQRKRDSIEGKSQIKWMNFQAKKKQWKLDQLLEKTMKERDDFVIIKTKTERQREELEQKLEDTIRTILTMSEMKINIEKVAAEINNTREEMLQTQKEMQNNKEEVKKYMVSKSLLIKLNVILI